MKQAYFAVLATTALLAGAAPATAQQQGADKAEPDAATAPQKPKVDVGALVKDLVDSVVKPPAAELQPIEAGVPASGTGSPAAPGGAASPAATGAAATGTPAAGSAGTTPPGPALPKPSPPVAAPSEPEPPAPPAVDAPLPTPPAVATPTAVAPDPVQPPADPLPEAPSPTIPGWWPLALIALAAAAAAAGLSIRRGRRIARTRAAVSLAPRLDGLTGSCRAGPIAFASPPMRIAAEAQGG